MIRRVSSQAGQTAAEYLGVLVVVAAVIGALATADPGRAVASGIQDAICRVAGSPGCDPGPGAGATDPAAVDRAAADLESRLEAGASPEEIAALFAELDPAVAEGLAAEHPELVGNTNGAPIALRYEANRVALDREIARLQDEGRGDDDSRLAKLRELRDGDGRFLLFDPSGDGRIAQVYGDLATADHVAVVVPGMNNELNNFSGANAARLQQQADQFSPGEVATIMWLGYDTPEGLTALGGGAADPGARDLPGFVNGISAARGTNLHTTVVAHSYGSLVTGKSMEHEGLQVDDVAFIGSPGVGAGSVDELTDGSTHIFAGVANSDFVGGSGWHGPPPTAESFGATEFHTGDISGHSSYFNEGSESLSNLGLIVAGHPDEVNTTR